MSEAFLQMAGVFSQLELAMIRSRVRSGMANAKAKGKQIGRPQTTKDDVPAIFLRHYPAYKSGHLNISELSRVCDLSRTTIYKYISLLEAWLKPREPTGSLGFDFLFSEKETYISFVGSYSILEFFNGICELIKTAGGIFVEINIGAYSRIVRL